MCIHSYQAPKADIPADGKTTEELVPQALALCDGRETTVLDLLSVKLQGVVRELETFLDERGELADAATLLAQNLLSMSSADDDLGAQTSLRGSRKGEYGDVTHLSAGVGNTDITSRVVLLGELTGEEIVQLRAEDTIGDELALLADLGGHLDGVLAGENGG